VGTGRTSGRQVSILARWGNSMLVSPLVLAVVTCDFEGPQSVTGPTNRRCAAVSVLSLVPQWSVPFNERWTLFVEGSQRTSLGMGLTSPAHWEPPANLNLFQYSFGAIIAFPLYSASRVRQVHDFSSQNCTT